MKTLLCLAAGALLLAGCTDPQSQPLWLAVLVDKTSLAMDDSVRVSIVVTNVSNRSVTTHTEDAYDRCLPGFEVADEQGRLVGMNVVCILDIKPTEPLEPGGSLSITSWWYPGISTVNGAAIPPGEYSIRAAIKSDDRLVRSGAFALLVTE